jgi:hypothetical protein
MPSVHPLQGDEMRALRELKRSADSPFVFTSERGTSFTKAGFAKMVARLGHATFFMLNAPVNEAVRGWTPASLPSDWPAILFVLIARPVAMPGSGRPLHGPAARTNHRPFIARTSGVLSVMM